MLNYQLLVLLFAEFVCSSHIAFSPPDESFLLFHGHQNTNFTSVFVQDGCPDSRSLRATIYSADQSDSRRVFEEIPLHCTAKIRIVTEKVDLERPYVDVLAVLDESFASHVSNVCVHVQLTSSTSSNELGKCVLNSREHTRTNCVIRVPVPFPWFPTEQNKTNVLSVSYTISDKCDQRFHDLPQHLIEITSRLSKQKVDVLANTTNFSVSLRSTSNQSFSQNSMQSLFVDVLSTPSNITSNMSDMIEIRLWIDSRVSIETVYPTSQNWSIRVSSASRPFFYTSLFCKPANNEIGFNGTIVALLIKMTSSSEIIKDDVVLHWHVLFPSTTTVHTEEENKSKDHKVATKFNVVPDEVAAVVVVPKRTEIMNTAVISGQQVTSSMRIFTVSIGAKAEDVTSVAHCISSDAKLLKTSPTCTSVYVDGSEFKGSSEVQVYAHYLRYTTSFSFRVWYPKLPLTIWTSSSTLYSIRNWKVGVWRDLGAPVGTVKRTRAARQFVCANRFQQSQIKVLASMWMEDSKTGDQLYLSSHKNILFDVTNIVQNTLHVSNRSVASIRFVDGKAILSGENIGKTRLVIRNIKLAQDLASENILVHHEEVAISGLSTRPICHVSLRILPILFSPAFFKIETSYSTTITKLYQQCSIDSSVSYSDATWEPLTHLDSMIFDMTAHSNDDRSLAVSHHFSNIHVIAIDEKNPLPSVEITLSPSSQCSGPSNSPMIPLATAVLNVPILFNSSSSSISMDSDSSSSNMLQNSKNYEHDSTLPSVPMHIFLLTIFLLIIIFLLITFIRRSAAFKGYEQLVAPLLSRLSSSSGSNTRHEDTNEWVWLSQPQPPTSTLGSDYSNDKSSYKRQSSNSDDPTRTSISYHGSEISVFIAPSQGNVMVNSSRTSSTRHALVDSTSDHNLARIVPKDDKWHNDPPFHTWTWKQRHGPPIRESVA